MVTIQAHRNAIVSYYDKARLSSSSGHGKSNSLSRHTNCKKSSNSNKSFVKLFSHLSLKMILVLFCVGLIVQAVISDNVLQDGDIETNPGPTYNIERVVQGSFHQRNRELFGEMQAFSVHEILCMLCVKFR